MPNCSHKVLNTRCSYGEVGTYILSQLLLKFFPDDAFPKDSTYPLSIIDFRLNILLPEAAANLIMYDRITDHYTAVQTMRRSGRYGTAIFPHDDPDIYDDMLSEALAAHGFGDGHAPTDVPSGGVVSPAPPGDMVSAFDWGVSALGDTNTLLTFADHNSESRAVSPTDSDPLEGSSVSPDFPGTGTRRRKLSRSSMPTILEGIDGEERITNQDHPVSKKARLA